MTRIFISYRREDSQEITGRLYDRLAAHFSPQSIFRDIDNIPAGVDFRQVLDAEISRCDIVLAIIGPKWVTATDKLGARRIENANDFVRIELESALRRQIRVIPILVSSAAMPAESDLPASIRDFAYRNGCAVRPDPDFHRDVDQLIERIAGTPTSAVPSQPVPAGRTPPFSRPRDTSPAASANAHDRTQGATGRMKTPLLIGGAVVVLLAAWLAIASLTNDPVEPPRRPEQQEGDQTANPATHQVERIDLLSLIDVERDASSGRWTLEDGTLRVRGRPKVNRMTFLTIPWEPPREYCLCLRVMRKVRDSGRFNIGLASGADRVAAVLDVQRKEKDAPRSGLLLVDGQPFAVPSTPGGGPVLPRGTKVDLRCTVRKEGIRVETNDRVVFDWRGNSAALSRVGTSQDPLFLGTSSEHTFEIDELWMEPLGPDRGRPLPQSTADAGK